MAKEKILVVEDEEDIVELITYNLSKEGYQVASVQSGEEVLETVQKFKPDLIVLDLMLPGMDGLTVCRNLKADLSLRHIPIVMLTAKSEEADIVAGLELGADDYITKPFQPRVFLARVRTILRRNPRETGEESENLQIYEILIQPGRHEVLVNDEVVNLTPTEFRLLHYLARRPGWVFTRSQIVDGVHGDDYPVTDRSVDVQVVGLRKKLGDAGKYIETVRGVGYRFKD